MQDSEDYDKKNGKANGEKSGNGNGREGNRIEVVRPFKRVNTLQEDVKMGLGSKPFQLPSKYFYDEIGSQLFDRICDVKEYYPTRAEQKLLEEYSDEIIKQTAPQHIIEFGSGTSRKTKLLLDSCNRFGVECTYWPMDICSEVLEDAQQSLQSEYSWLKVRPLLVDYLAGISHIKLPNERKLSLFLGGTIGNLPPEICRELMREINSLLDNDDRLLLGADMVKDKDVMEAAYDDSEGVTAAFNLNMLAVINRELDANFVAENFSHRSVYDESKECVEMHLVSEVDQSIRINALDMDVVIKKGEFIHTSSSRKFTQDSLDDLMDSSSYEPERHFVTEDKPFSLLLLRPSDSSS